MRARRKSPAATVVHGLLAGVIGNAIFTAYQQLTQNSDGGSTPKDWSDTPEPAQVGQRVAEGVFQTNVPLEKAGVVANIVHWIYGTSWGAVYGLIEESVEQPVISGLALASTVVATDYTLLPAMNLYKPPWRYPASTLGKDFGHHLVYGLAVAGAYKAIDVVIDGTT